MQQQYKFDIAILGHHPGNGMVGLFKRLHEDRQWELVYADAIAAIFARKSAAANTELLHRPLIQIPEPPPLPELRQQYMGNALSGLSIWRQPCQAAAYERIGWGFIALYTGQTDKAVAHMLDAALRSPQIGTCHLSAAMAALQAGDRELFVQASRYTILIEPGNPEIKDLCEIGRQVFGVDPQVFK
jgi:hypothetical protein